MKQELFKEMYNGIQLNEDQKSKIWNHLEEELIKETTGKRKHFHTTAAAGICICIILIIGVPVVAANTSVLQNIINAFNTLAPAEPKLSDGQKKIYSFQLASKPADAFAISICMDILLRISVVVNIMVFF